MEKLKILVVIIASFFFVNSCSDDEGMSSSEQVPRVVEVKGPTITFGRYYGKCIGNSCIEIFRLIDLTLLEDTLDNYPISGVFYQGKFTQFKGSAKIKTSDILPSFPLELLDSKVTTYGTPDAGDWGGIYLEYQDGDYHRYWFLDLHIGNNPKFVREYVTLLNDRITEIGEVNNQN